MTNGGDKTVVAALRNMLKYTSEKIDTYVKNDMKSLELRADHTPAGAQYFPISRTQPIHLSKQVLIGFLQGPQC